MWSVINFETDNTVEVVPSHWFKKNGQCAWPKTTNKKYIHRAVFKKIIPNKTDFNYFDARCMARNIDNFANAQRKCEFAKTRSDISSGADENQYKISKRLKNKKRTLINSSSESDREQSSDDDDNDMPSLISDTEHNILLDKSNHDNMKRNGWSPLKTKVTDAGVNLLEKNPNTYCNLEKEISIQKSSTPLIIAGGHSKSFVSGGAKRSLLFDQTDLLKLDSSEIPASKTNYDDSLISAGSSDNGFQKSVLHQLLTMKFEIRTIDEKLNNLTQLVEENNNNLKSKINETDISDNYQFDDIDLPINSLDMLDNLEIKLMNDKTYRAHLVKRLSAIGGKTIKIMVKRIMSILFMQELLCEFSYNGRGNKKHSFSKLMINKLIFQSVQQIKKFSMIETCTNDIEEVIKYVLIQSPFKLKKNRIL
ncbi:unnamed protein product [Macrosiphum euphorbiae]|uniref:DUF4806 domain-containing protein n=1 Tax=Macrosiphum euphorbiae TaxID=13131 RepID=A0AAV0XSS5_9HEMI|nr:unnamed protein product [Macrosiphum euphorbiae]